MRSASESPRDHPDLLVVVMDCVRAEDFLPGSEGRGSLPFLSALRRESTVYARAVAPGTWTIPSHASLFTGLYPWEHGLHARGRPSLDERTPVISEELRAAGYATLSLSANPFISDRVGLTRGFETASWGGWWERHLRHLAQVDPPGGRNGGGGTPRLLHRLRNGPAWPATLALSRQALRFPYPLNVANRALFTIRGTPRECPLCVSSWIEPTLERWLSGQPPGRPTFTFVNLMDAHEPYFVPRGEGGLLDRLGAEFTRQDFTHWLEGEWAPSPAELRRLREMYRSAIDSLDHRIRNLVEIYQRADRWDSTFLVLTSDHGQATGENGWLSHGMTVDETLTRVPLWVRRAGAPPSTASSGSWASLVDVRPSLREWAGLPLDPGSGVPLDRLAREPRPGPVWTMSEGVLYDTARRRMSAERLARYDRVLFAGYQGDVRTVYDVTEPGGRAYRIGDRISRAENPLPVDAPPASGMLSYSALLARALEPPANIAGESVTARIESWGYC